CDLSQCSCRKASEALLHGIKSTRNHEVVSNTATRRTNFDALTINGHFQRHPHPALHLHRLVEGIRGHGVAVATIALLGAASTREPRQAGSAAARQRTRHASLRRTAPILCDNELHAPARSPSARCVAKSDCGLYPTSWTAVVAGAVRQDGIMNSQI